MPVLYVVATPIGNLEDVTLRALRVLREVKLVAAEDTRKTRRLLNAYDIKTPMTSYYEHNKMTKLEYILDFLKEGDVALVSDAGMPGISDPGYELIAAASERRVQVVPIPGASSVTTALAVSGLPTDRFIYIGFLPNKASARREALKTAANEPGTIIILEAPHRIIAALDPGITQNKDAGQVMVKVNPDNLKLAFETEFVFFLKVILESRLYSTKINGPVPTGFHLAHSIPFLSNEALETCRVTPVARLVNIEFL